jgi:hypothetical protein
MVKEPIPDFSQPEKRTVSPNEMTNIE